MFSIQDTNAAPPTFDGFAPTAGRRNPMGTSGTSRGWVFTLNNWTESELETLNGAFNRENSSSTSQHRGEGGSVPARGGHILYLCWQQETAESGTPHLQGYFEVSKPIRRVGAGRLLRLPRAHIERRMGTREQARDYCRKEDSRIEGSFVEWGTFSPGGQGTRNDLAAAVELAKQFGLNGILEECPTVYIKYSRGMEKYCAWLESQARQGTFRGGDAGVKVKIYWGPTGTGKSHRAATEYPGAYTWPKPANGHAYALNYQGEEVIIFDEFYSWIPYDLLLRVCDKYTLILNTQGAAQYCNAHTIIFTSNMDPMYWYPSIEDKSALWRRVDEIVEMNEPYTS